jgi:hypothetical protein
MRSFGHALKNAPLAPNVEQTVFEYDCTAAPCIITHINIPSIKPPVGQDPDWEHGRIAFYVDEESSAAIDVTILQLAAISKWGSTHGVPADGSPWGIDLIGKPAAEGGIYSTIRIPFQKSIRITIRAPPSAHVFSEFFFNVRGVEASPVQLGEYVLPNSAKLRAERHENVGMTPFSFMRVLNSTRAGALLLVQFDGNAVNFGFLEACVRANIDGHLTFLSSGMEDYFLSSCYFDEGRYVTPNAGMTFMSIGAPGLEARVGAFKTHTRDVIFWNQSMELIWRYGEELGKCGDTAAFCPTEWCGKASSGPKSPTADAARDRFDYKFTNDKTSTSGTPDVGAFSTVVWLYEWSW